MNREEPDTTTAYGWSFEETERRQLLQGLEMTPLERLRWLDRRKRELQSLLGKAGGGHPQEVATPAGDAQERPAAGGGKGRVQPAAQDVSR